MAAQSSTSIDLNFESSFSEIDLKGNSDFEDAFNQAKLKIREYFKRIHDAATEIEFKLLVELEQFATTQRDVYIHTNSLVEHMNIIIANPATDVQLRKNMNNEIFQLNTQKRVSIDMTVDQNITNFINNSVSISIQMASQSNLEKVLSSNPHPLIHYSKQKDMISFETYHAHLRMIKSLFRNQDYIERGSYSIWYLIGRNWVEQWLNHEKYVKPVNGLIPIPPPIDNSDIMDDDRSRELKNHHEYNTIHVHKDNEYIIEELVMGRDFAIFNEAAWGKLVEWYGIKEGTVEFPRPIASLDNNEITLDLYPQLYIYKFKYYSMEEINIIVWREIKEVSFFAHDTDLSKLDAIKRALGIPLNSEILIFQQNSFSPYPTTSKHNQVAIHTFAKPSESDYHLGASSVQSTSNIIYFVIIKSN